MSNKDLARRTKAEITFAGVNITKDIQPYLLSLTYTDNEDGEADDLQLTLQDRDGLWLESWLAEAVEKAASGQLKIGAALLAENWQGGGQDKLLDCGTFELDSICAQAPPAVVTIKATALPFSAEIRQTLHSRAWENYTLSGIAQELAVKAGLQCMYEAAADPFYSRVEQARESDIAFLQRLCRKAGLNLKATGTMLVLFDQAAYEQKPAVFTIRRGTGAYTKYKLNSGSAGTQYGSCRVSYVDPATGKCIEGIFKAADKSGSSQRLEVAAKCANAAEAIQLAEKYLRLHNRFAQTASFDLPGNVEVAAGLTGQLEDFGPTPSGRWTSSGRPTASGRGWSGKYIISQARHSLSGSGYTTHIDLRRVLEGY